MWEKIFKFEKSLKVEKNIAKIRCLRKFLNSKKV